MGPGRRHGRTDRRTDADAARRRPRVRPPRQQVSGILEAYHELRYAASSRDGVLFLSRQAELQASCFAAVFVGANRRTLPVTGAVRTQWDWLVAHSGDRPPYPRDHGSFANHAFWSKRGFDSRSPGACRTFVASPRYNS